MDDDGLPGYRGDLSRNAVTITEALKPAAYSTLMCGKWHVTPETADSHNWPLRRGFDKFYGTIPGAGNYFNPVTLTRDNTPIEIDRKDYYYADALGDQASAYIREHRVAKPETPFFLYSECAHGPALAGCMRCHPRSTSTQTSIKRAGTNHGRRDTSRSFGWGWQI